MSPENDPDKQLKERVGIILLVVAVAVIFIIALLNPDSSNTEADDSPSRTPTPQLRQSTGSPTPTMPWDEMTFDEVMDSQEVIFFSEGIAILGLEYGVPLDPLELRKLVATVLTTTDLDEHSIGLYLESLRRPGWETCRGECVSDILTIQLISQESDVRRWLENFLPCCELRR